LILVSVFILLGGMLAACGEKQKPQVNLPQRTLTEGAQTRIAQTNAPPTAGPSPSPSATSTPYLTPTQFPDADPSTIVAKVGNREITLAEYQARVRYERWLPLVGLRRSVRRQGADQVLDLTKPENTQMVALFYTLNDPESMGTQTMNVMLTDQIVLREAAVLDLELSQTAYYGRVAARIGVELESGVNIDTPEDLLPPEWDEAYAAFIEEMELYTGMTEAQFIETVEALVYYDQLLEVIGEQAPLEEEGIIAVNVEDLLLNSREDALEVIDRLRDGGALRSVATSYGLEPQSGDTVRTVRRRDADASEQGLPADIVDAVFDASAGDVIGPFATDAGWYVARIIDLDLDFLQADDVGAARTEFFRQWIISRLDDPTYTVDYENWMDFIPTDPLPKDVSPLMRDEAFTLPDDPFAEDDEVPPTPLPFGNSPR
jgi:hypothetical protein